MKLKRQIDQCLQQGELLEAKRLCEEVRVLNKDDIDNLQTLGLINARIKHWEEALECFQDIRALSDDFSAYFNLGRVRVVLEQYEAALQCFAKAVQLKRDFSEAYFNIGRLYFQQSHWRQAQEYFEKALQFPPDVANPHYYLGKSQQDQLQIDSDIRSYQAVVHNELGKSFRNQGRSDAAIKHYQLALQLKPDFTEAHSNLLFIISYNVMCLPQELLDQHCAWDRNHGGSAKLATFKHNRLDDPDRRLRIAYISPAFRFHVISFFMEPILKSHDRKKVEVFCYAEVSQPDDFTARLKGLVDGWRSTVGMSNLDLARMIYDDQIDILVDLAGHTNNSRLKALTYKPAPVQATYLGYFTTTGIEAMDYWITDDILHPENTTELAVETLYRLPRCCVCYQPPSHSPLVITQERKYSGITFGSFNDLLKITPRTISLWSRVLKETPDSRLLIKSGSLADSEIKKEIQEKFLGQGIASERLILMPPIESHYDHLAYYGEVDIALDTVPRTGGTTTADSLWMGVPTITLAGALFIERLSATMISAVGVEELIAGSEEEYINKAVMLAADPDRRMYLRERLRTQMAGSPLCDGEGLARALEDAYRDMWERYLQ